MSIDPSGTEGCGQRAVAESSYVRSSPVVVSMVRLGLGTPGSDERESDGHVILGIRHRVAADQSARGRQVGSVARPTRGGLVPEQRVRSPTGEPGLACHNLQPWCRTASRSPAGGPGLACHNLRPAAGCSRPGASGRHTGSAGGRKRAPARGAGRRTRPRRCVICDQVAARVGSGMSVSAIIWHAPRRRYRRPRLPQRRQLPRPVAPVRCRAHRCGG